MSLTKKHLEPLATMIGAALLDAGVESIADLPYPTRMLALEVRSFAARYADRFDAYRFDAWAVEVAKGERYPGTGQRIPASQRRAAVSA